MCRPWICVRSMTTRELPLVASSRGTTMPPVAVYRAGTPATTDPNTTNPITAPARMLSRNRRETRRSHRAKVGSAQTSWPSVWAGAVWAGAVWAGAVWTGAVWAVAGGP